MTTSVSQAPAQVVHQVRVWDAPVRVFHWLMALCFAGAYITSDSETWRLLHVTLGYTLGGLVVFRLLWGLVGSRYARFASFVRGPRAVLRYLRSLTAKQPEHHLGHNPAGALAIVLLLALGLVMVASGWAVYNDLGPQWLEDLHELAGNTMLAVVVVHLLGVLTASWLHHENLVRSMVTGFKAGTTREAIGSNWRAVAAAVVLSVLGFWWFQWQSAPVAGGTTDSAQSAAPSAMAVTLRKQDHEKDDD
jgi:cytochrome b